MTIISVPRCRFIAEEIALDIVGWSLSELRYAQDYNGYPIPIRLSDMLVLETENIVRWARSRQFQVVRHTIAGA
ncbi:hypothetical protein SAMN04488498_11979 [Mesorhizobium albiziae]|uniref:Uncharacterized protein n=1 Tax=Neomesorhizobium albiziae TaxID=335020 RepID=A0A1I4DVY5_9HYPH|nr:hypothetical protein [Mesorhizobium albiziae]SFK96387.1 hypothetical protein SAMN04488498_11979 [Mesorhizobium albiziae]